MILHIDYPPYINSEEPKVSTLTEHNEVGDVFNAQKSIGGGTVSQSISMTRL